MDGMLCKFEEDDEDEEIISYHITETSYHTLHIIQHACIMDGMLCKLRRKMKSEDEDEMILP